MTGRQTLKDFLANGLLVDPVKKILDHLEIDIRFQKGQSDFLQRLRDGFFFEDPLTPKFLEDTFKFLAERIKHTSPHKKAIEDIPYLHLRSPRKI